MAIECTLLLLLFISLINEICAHGVMQSPPARNYMWRLGYDTERNYDDMGLNCGGFSVNMFVYTLLVEMAIKVKLYCTKDSRIYLSHALAELIRLRIAKGDPL